MQVTYYFKNQKEYSQATNGVTEKIVEYAKGNKAKNKTRTKGPR